MRDRRWRYSLGPVFDVAMHPVDKSAEQCAHDERQQCPILDGHKGGQRKEVESDILVVQGIVRAVGHLIDEAQKSAPVADFPPGDEQSEEAATRGDHNAPQQPLAQEFQRIGQRRGGRKRRVEGRGQPASAPGEAKCKARVCPQDGGGRRENNEEDGGFRADRGPEDPLVAYRGEPHPVDQDVAHDSEQDQANCDNAGRDDESHHGASPWCLPFGSGNPDGHSGIIAERQTWRACRGGAASAFCSPSYNRRMRASGCAELGRTREFLGGLRVVRFVR